MDDTGAPSNENQQRILTVDGKTVELKSAEEEKAKIAAEKAELDAKLARGEINGIEYNKRLIELRVPEKYESQKRPQVENRGRAKLIAIAIFIVSAIPAAIYMNWRFYFQNTLTAANVLDYSDTLKTTSVLGPLQIDFDESVTEIGKYKGKPIEINYRAYYDIAGTVTSVHDYWGFDAYDSLVPRDVCIAWDGTATSYRMGLIEFSQGERYCTGKTDSPNWSNNHIIPSTAEVRGQVFNLRAGDEVRLVGYLVSVSYDGIILDSSMTRADTGNHACEVFYVTKIEKNPE